MGWAARVTAVVAGMGIGASVGALAAQRIGATAAPAPVTAPALPAGGTAAVSTQGAPSLRRDDCTWGITTLQQDATLDSQAAITYPDLHDFYVTSSSHWTVAAGWLATLCHGQALPVEDVTTALTWFDSAHQGHIADLQHWAAASSQYEWDLRWADNYLRLARIFEGQH